MSDWRDFNQQVIKEFRSNEGQVGGRFAGRRLLLLHTTGAKSGKERITPLMTQEDGERLVVIASKGGAPSHPDWYYNLLANPQVEVEYGTDRFAARAEVAAEPLRSSLYAQMAAEMPFFADYEKQAERTIPVVTLTRL